ncbi:teichoic acid glycosylation protein GtcA [Spirochaetia bacterium]|nr:teichoic acid glycosylation protein GtcA [Spirochaetia bacterium]
MLKKIFTKEVINYIIWGLATTVWNVGVFQILLLTGMDYRAANAISLVTTKVFAYIVNKFFVFKSHCASNGALLLEIGRFALARGFTMLVDFFGLILLNFVIEPKFGKIITTAVVIILNYIFGKFHVFTEKPARTETGG